MGRPASQGCEYCQSTGWGFCCRGRPLKPRGKASTDGQVGTPGNSVGAPEWLPKLLMTVGAAVIALLLFKRMRAI
jgi:hypothetical protein